MAADPTPTPTPAPTPHPDDAAEGEHRYYLAVFDDKLRRVPVAEGTLLIGRSRDVHLRIHDHLLSRKHCALTRSGDQVILSDLNSSNGTYVNGERIGTRSLAVDDIIEFGKTVMVLFDGEGWSRGDGLLDLRNPVKAQELVQRLREGGVGIESIGAPPTLPSAGVRPRKGLSDDERDFLTWLEKTERRHLPDLVGEYLTHKLISLLVRRSPRVRAAFTSVLETMMRPEFLQRFGDARALHSAVRDLVRAELEDLPAAPPPSEAPPDRGLLEPESELAEEEGEDDAR